MLLTIFLYTIYIQIGFVRAYVRDFSVSLRLRLHLNVSGQPQIDAVNCACVSVCLCKCVNMKQDSSGIYQIHLTIWTFNAQYIHTVEVVCKTEYIVVENVFVPIYERIKRNRIENGSLCVCGSTPHT